MQSREEVLDGSTTFLLSGQVTGRVRAWVSSPPLGGREEEVSGCEESTGNPEALHEEATTLAFLRASRLVSSLMLQNNRMVQSTGFWGHI